MSAFYEKNGCKMFTYRFTSFMWQVDSQKFEPIRYDVLKSFNEICASADLIMSEKKREFHRMLFGSGVIEVPKPNIILYTIDQLMSPFYMFQIFALGIWYWEAYTTFAIVLTVLAVFSIASTVFDLAMA